MTAVALRRRSLITRRAVKENLLRVLSTLIVSSLVASIGFAQDATSEKTGRHRSIESERKEAADGPRMLASLQRTLMQEKEGPAYAGPSLLKRAVLFRTERQLPS
jgi:hypothetical protein